MPNENENENETLPVKEFPALDAFHLSNNVNDGVILSGLIRENPSNVMALFLGPSFSLNEIEEPNYLGMVSACKFDEGRPEFEDLATKYYAAGLAIWKPEISRVHIFTTNNLRWCLGGGNDEGGKVVSTLKQASPETVILFTTPAAIFAVDKRVGSLSVNERRIRSYLFILMVRRWRGSRAIEFTREF